MFDIAFTELLVIGIVALIVIGPERLPKVARTAGTWLGKLNRYVAQVKQDIDRDMQLEELRKLQAQMKASAQKYELMAEEASQKVRNEVGQVDKVMQAMAATDGGLALQEYEKIKAEAASGSGGADMPADLTPEQIPRQADEFQSSLDDEIVADAAPSLPDTVSADAAESTQAPAPGPGVA
jgi:sec-independent protein translocase protein TatB